MATFGEQIFSKLTAATAVTALVATRIYPNKAPQGAGAPRIVFLVVSDVPNNTLDGDVASRQRQARLQVDCYAEKYLDAQALAEAVDSVLGNLSGPGLSGWRENSTDLWDEEAQLHRVLMEFWLAQ